MNPDEYASLEIDDRCDDISAANAFYSSVAMLQGLPTTEFLL